MWRCCDSETLQPAAPRAAPEFMIRIVSNTLRMAAGRRIFSYDRDQSATRPLKRGDPRRWPVLGGLMTRVAKQDAEQETKIGRRVGELRDQAAGKRPPLQYQSGVGN